MILIQVLQRSHLYGIKFDQKNSLEVLCQFVASMLGAHRTICRIITTSCRRSLTTLTILEVESCLPFLSTYEMTKEQIVKNLRLVLVIRSAEYVYDPTGSTPSLRRNSDSPPWPSHQTGFINLCSRMGNEASIYRAIRLTSFPSFNLSR
jgi:hypothetical protein